MVANLGGILVIVAVGSPSQRLRIRACLRVKGDVLTYGLCGVRSISVTVDFKLWVVHGLLFLVVPTPSPRCRASTVIAFRLCRGRRFACGGGPYFGHSRLAPDPPHSGAAPEFLSALLNHSLDEIPNKVNTVTQEKVFSGIQPTGDIHIGNYIGALRNWVAMQAEYDAIYCVVDLHALTQPQNPAELSAARMRTAKILLAAGIDPQRSLLYHQSQVPQHAELSWILGTFASMGHLGRMIQYKDKGDKGSQNLGLFSYPVLMAADILLHKVHAVPVGDDQSQHLEFTRDLAERFNARFGEIFPIPEQVTPGLGARVMSLKDLASKMSKSDPDVKSRVLVIDEPDVIRKKIRSAVTDSGSGIAYDLESKAGVSNLLNILAVFADRTVDDLVTEYADVQYGTFKDVVADAIIEGFSPLRQTYKSLEDVEVERLMAMGALEARARAEQTMSEVRGAVGLNG